MKRTSHRQHGREIEVWRDSGGQFRSAPRGTRALAELKATARRLVSMEDRIGKRLRFGTETNGWWYMIKGPRRWIRREANPGWHHGYYYSPRHWTPVVPPRAAWESRDSYVSPPGTPMSSMVPKDVWDAAHTFDRPGRVDSLEDPPARVQAYMDRRTRLGLGDEERRPSKRIRIRTIRRKR